MEITRAKFDQTLSRIAQSDKSPEDKRRLIKDFGSKFTVVEDSELPSLDSQLRGLSPEQRDEFTKARLATEGLSQELDRRQTRDQEKLDGLEGELIAGVGNAADAATFGRGDEIAALAQRVLPAEALQNLVSGEDSLGQRFLDAGRSSIDSLSSLTPEAIAREADANQRSREAAADANPVAGIAGTVAGIAAPIVASLGTAAPALSAGQIAARGIGIGALGGLAADTRQAGETEFVNAQRALTNAAIGGTVGAVLPGVGAAARATSNKLTKNLIGFRGASKVLRNRKDLGGLEGITKEVVDSGALKGTVVGGRKKLVENLDNIADQKLGQLDDILVKSEGTDQAVNLLSVMDDFLSDSSLKSIKKTGENLDKTRKKAENFLLNILDEEGESLGLRAANRLRKQVDDDIFRGNAPESKAFDNQARIKFRNILKKDLDTKLDDLAKQSGSDSTFREIKTSFAKIAEANKVATDKLASEDAKLPVSLRNLLGGGLALTADSLAGLGFATGATLANNPRGQSLISQAINRAPGTNGLGGQTTQASAVQELLRSLNGE